MSPCYYSTKEREPELTSTEIKQGCALTLTILHLYTGAVMRDLAMEQYHMVYPEWHGSALNQPRKEESSEFHAATQKEGEEQITHHNAYCHSCLVSAYAILIM